MKCPNCNFKIENEKICINCGTNIYLVKKIDKLSIKLYNTALEKLLFKDFENAIRCLKKSIDLNKFNVDARNLLGLSYYHIGKLAPALKQWIISSNLNKDPKKNIAFKYINIFQNNIRKFEKLNDSVKLYNQAISYIKQRNDDLAIIRLKRSLDINPNFVEALNLLSFCYIIQGKAMEALESAKKVLSIDVSNSIAIRYISIINKSSKKNINQVVSDFQFNGKIKIIDKNKQNSKMPFIIKEGVSFFFGAILVFLFMYFLVIPNIMKEKQNQIDTINQRYIQTQQNYTKSQIEQTDETKTLKEESQLIKNQNLVLQNKVKILEAFVLSQQDKVNDAINLINSIDKSNFSNDDINIYNYFKSIIEQKNS